MTAAHLPIHEPASHEPGSKEKLRPNSDQLTWKPLMDGLSKKSKTHLYGKYREPSSVLMLNFPHSLVLKSAEHTQNDSVWSMSGG